MSYRVGIDLGGTNIAVGVVNEAFEIISYTTTPTEAHRSAQAVVDSMCEAVRTVLRQAGLSEADCDSIGIGAPGTCDPRSGVVYRSYSMNWTDLPLGDMIARQFPTIPVRVENDANCAALAEVKAGAARGKDNIVLVTLGTGVGSGIVLNGKIYSGLKGNGAEMGHMMLQLGGALCFCGRHGCWDAYASATALIRLAKEAAEAYPDSLLNESPELNGKLVFDAADRGDATAQAVIDQYCHYLAVGISNIVNALAPEMILIGGGISRQGERILKPIREYIAANCFDKRPEALPVVAAAQMGNEAGIVGAAAL